MSDWQRMIYGDDAVNKREIFLKRLAEIEEKYKYWFEKRPGQFERQNHDELSNHTLMAWDHDQTKFGFQKNSELPKMIIDECLEAFKDVFDNTV